MVDKAHFLDSIRTRVNLFTANVFVAASCEVSRFDRVAEATANVNCLLSLSFFSILACDVTSGTGSMHTLHTYVDLQKDIAPVQTGSFDKSIYE